jgi:hypothetical protein
MRQSLQWRLPNFGWGSKEPLYLERIMAAQSKGVIKRISVTPTIDTAGAFADGDAMHDDAIELPNALQHNASGKIRGVCLTDLDKKTTDLSIHFFTADISSTSTVNKNASLDIADADLPKHLGHIRIASADYESFNDNCEATVEATIPVDIETEGTRSLYMVLKSKDTDNFSTATALTVQVFVEQD